MPNYSQIHKVRSHQRNADEWSVFYLLLSAERWLATNRLKFINLKKESFLEVWLYSITKINTNKMCLRNVVRICVWWQRARFNLNSVFNVILSNRKTIQNPFVCLSLFTFRYRTKKKNKNNSHAILVTDHKNSKSLWNICNCHAIVQHHCVSRNCLQPAIPFHFLFHTTFTQLAAPK